MRGLFKKNPQPSLSPLISLIAFLLAFQSVLSAPSPDFRPVYRPSLAVTRVDKNIDIDGRLGDPGWMTAARIENFVERFPGDNTPPEVVTRAYITYDDSRLYVAFVCLDDPASIRSTMSPRDRWGGDDAVCLLLDTYGNAAWAYEFYVNPYGIQRDHLWTGVGGEDSGYDLIWESAAQRTDSGYQVEMAIPFSSLRFPNRETQSWRVDFWRERPRESFKQYSWAAYDRNEQCWPCQWGTIEGISAVHPGKGLEILPAIVAHQTGNMVDYGNPWSSFDNEKVDGEISLGTKYAVSSDITVEAAFNPDFSQIESDAAQIDVNSTIALFYPERRPFFQEGSDIFRTLFNSFYTWTINDPQVSVKLTGRMGRTTLGGIVARDENTPYIIPLDQSSIYMNSGKSTATVIRGSRAFGESNNLGMFFSDRRFEDGGIGSVLALDGNIRVAKGYTVDGQFIGTYTREINDPSLTARYDGLMFDGGTKTVAFDGEKYYGSAFISRFYRRARHWNFMFDYNQVDPTYRTEVGYDPVINHRSFTFSSSYTFYPQNNIFNRITPSFYDYNRWYFDGDRQTQRRGMNLNTQLGVFQSYCNLAFAYGSHEFAGTTYKDLWEYGLYMGSTFSDQLGLDLAFEKSRDIAYFARAKGDLTEFSVYLGFKPLDRLLIEPNLEYARMTDYLTGVEYFKGYITRTRLQYQANKELSLRVIVQYDDFDRIWEVDPLLTYRLSPFSVFYIGSAYNYGDIGSWNERPSEWRVYSRQFFMKLQYLFQT